MTLYRLEINEAISFANKVYMKYKDFIKDPLKFRADAFVINIIYREGIQLDSYPFSSDMCGIFIDDEYEKTILYNIKQIPERRNFTLGHELGHYFMHSDKQSQFTDRTKDLMDNSIKPFEIQANVFASYILLPTYILESMLLSKFNFFRIKKEINISYKALFWRLVNYFIEVYELSTEDAILITEEYRQYSIKKLNNEAHHINAQLFKITHSNKDRVISLLKNANIDVSYAYNEDEIEPRNKKMKHVLDIIRGQIGI
ncbi:MULTISPECIES: ImmA/IrrE family metallo-endopeptidase [Bacillus]|uniref:ImmA/IrrE family metallo-endopeptidase n=1 Tax=Bacillus TaxID=1386 RepID=UPI00227F7022|nr:MULTISPECIES: ImmA/IrrE family metallo-endopeptidase [Bacillus]MCY7572397.1 ImmA/IrrE family metallo-endopeptidase [Bacillus pumilus]MCY7577601.1 ImmA/IrrE family metallo-endopeptidase [Bacillus pumilus]MCY7692722.1 ImmA/IrrE family metallo-endopeptidase [Bacillus altitudinis]MEC3761095.1 ImmA/IrrE family metallo-endopeptidase [Bacillus pumilus]